MCIMYKWKISATKFYDGRAIHSSMASQPKESGMSYDEARANGEMYAGDFIKVFKYDRVTLAIMEYDEAGKMIHAEYDYMGA